MTLNDFRNVEFGVCFNIDNQVYHYKIPVDASVKQALVEMRNTFCSSYDSIEGVALEFEASEKYASDEKLRINLNQDYLANINNLYHHQNIPVNNINLSDNLANTEYYFAEFLHTNGSKTIGVKRPNQFKALLKKKIVRLTDNTLHAVGDDIFKLDNDFDFLMHDTFVEILHPSGFIFISDLEEQIFNSVPETTRIIGTSITFVNFSSIREFVQARNSKKAAKLLTSIKARQDLHLTNQEKLLEFCNRLNLAITIDGDGKMVAHDDHIIDFLEILDRRSYDYDITSDEPEIYVASSRKKK